MFNFIKKLTTTQIIAFSFIMVIFLGSILLIMPFSLNSGINISFLDSLYTSTSAVCVTGLTTIDVGTTFTAIGQTIIAILIQIGGLGVTLIGAGIILAIGKKMNLKSMNIVKEAMNLDSGKGIKKFVKNVLCTAIIIELIGALINFTIFIHDFPFFKALGISLFHSVSAFNNAGFDIFGNFQGLLGYQNNIALNLVTSVLIILGGIGFLVLKEIWTTKFNWKKFSMHTKVVLSISLTLLLSGTILIKCTENVTWLGAFFLSVSSRTAGFSTYTLTGFSKAGLLIISILMFIGTSPGSTGGGIKTTTFFALFQGIKSSAINKSEKAFHYSLPKDSYKKASTITILASTLIILSIYLFCCFEPNLQLIDIVFEVTSAFSTTGLSTGITPNLSVGSKIVSMIIMYIGRLGPLTIATLWHFNRGDRFMYPEGNLSIG